MTFTDAALRPDGTGNSSTFAGLGVVLDLKASPLHTSTLPSHSSKSFGGFGSHGRIVSS
jgi:hypothetical protein